MGVPGPCVTVPPPHLTRAGRSDGLEGHRAVTVAHALGRDSTEGFLFVAFLGISFCVVDFWGFMHAKLCSC